MVLDKVTYHDEKKVSLKPQLALRTLTLHQMTKADYNCLIRKLREQSTLNGVMLPIRPDPN